MKKFWLLALALPALFFATTSANSDCEELEFDDATLCITLDKESNTEFQFDVEVTDTNGPIALLCTASLAKNSYPNVPDV